MNSSFSLALSLSVSTCLFLSHDHSLSSFFLPLFLPPPISASYFSLSFSSLENIYTQHHYTDGLLNASIAAASAGTCLEDGNADDKKGNAFANLGDAVGKVCAHVILKECVCVCACVCLCLLKAVFIIIYYSELHFEEEIYEEEIKNCLAAY